MKPSANKRDFDKEAATWETPPRVKLVSDVAGAMLKQLLKQFYRVLLPGGQIAIADLDEEGGRFHDNNDGVFHFGFDRENLARLFADAGFSDIDFTTATQIDKSGADGSSRLFSLFLMTGSKLPVKK